jgi:hypothetical protein
MHFHRLMALTGVIIGVIGLFFSGLSTEGEGAMAGLSAAFAEQGVDFADGIPTIWGGLATWAQWTLVVLIIVTVILAFVPPRERTYDRTGAMLTSVIGVALLAYAVYKYIDAGNKADDLEAGFAQAAQLGLPGIEAWSVSPSIGFFVLIVGTVVVAAAGVLSMMSTSE